MGDIKGFLKVKRGKAEYRPVCERIKDYKEVILPRPEAYSKEQASRCMDCGTPFCHWGCPVGNYIPEWNDAMFSGHWKKAIDLLSATNNFPEITGRVCPATCEYACVLGINDDPVTIRENELSIIEYAFKKGYIKPARPKKRTQKKIAIVGSGPSGLAAADQLNKAGHRVVVFEKDANIGGIMRYGIPDFKIEKWILDRRINILKKEGIKFKTGINIGDDIAPRKLLKEFDALLLCAGSNVPRDLKLEGRELKGIYFAMDYLVQSNKKTAGEKVVQGGGISAKGKKVVVIGGGDTGADCVGVANRDGASCVTQIELLERPPECRTGDFSWPKYPMVLKTSTSHEEGAERRWAVLTKKFIGQNGWIKKLNCVEVEFSSEKPGVCPLMKEVPGTGFEIEADLVILAMGFLHTEHGKLVKDLALQLDERGNIRTDSSFMASIKGVFSAGDMHTGQSLIVRAISEGRKAAYAVDKYLVGESYLPLI